MDDARRARLEAAGRRNGAEETPTSEAEELSSFRDAIVLGLADLDEGRETDVQAARKRHGLPNQSQRS
jgi:hypothetical protein